MLYRLSMRESELSLNESKVADLGSLLSKAHEEKQAMLQLHQEQFSRDRQVGLGTLIIVTFSARSSKCRDKAFIKTCWRKPGR